MNTARAIAYDAKSTLPIEGFDIFALSSDLLSATVNVLYDFHAFFNFCNFHLSPHFFLVFMPRSLSGNDNQRQKEDSEKWELLMLRTIGVDDTYRFFHLYF